jgi:uroporphyrinogen-III synthase
LIKRLFISKSKNELSLLPDFVSEKGVELICHSFLEFHPISFEVNNSDSVIFFGSPRAVKYFLAQSSIPKNVKVAAVGESTADALIDLGHSVDFIGEGDSIQQTAEDFKSWCGDEKVLFPMSTISLKTVSKLFADSQKEEVVVYETKISSEEILSCDVYVFTSPSNVNGFLLKNNLPENAIIIAWGESTYSQLISSGITNAIILDSPSEKVLIKELDNIIGK